MKCTGAIRHIRRRLDEFDPLFLKPSNSASGFIDKSPDQAWISAPMAVIHNSLKRFVTAISNIALALYIALNRKHPLSLIGASPDMPHLLEDNNLSSSFGSG